MMKFLLRRLHAPVYEKRLEVLCALLAPHLRPAESLLDVGCGSGELGRRLADRADLDVQGLEVQPRENCLVPVTAYQGNGAAFPFGDHTFDTVLLADILHHEEDPAHVLREAARVARRRVIVKDHKIDGPLAWARISFIDWAANAGYGVPCLYRYLTAEQWAEQFRSCGLQPQSASESIDLYPWGLNALFGKRLQYLAVLGVES